MGSLFRGQCCMLHREQCVKVCFNHKSKSPKMNGIVYYNGISWIRTLQIQWFPSQMCHEKLEGSYFLRRPHITRKNDEIWFSFQDSVAGACIHIHIHNLSWRLLWFKRFPTSTVSGQQSIQQIPISNGHRLFSCSFELGCTSTHVSNAWFCSRFAERHKERGDNIPTRTINFLTFFNYNYNLGAQHRP